MLTWSEKLSLLTQKGLSWKEVQELDKGLEEEKNNPPKDDPKDEPKDEPTEAEKKLLEKIESLETQLKEAQADNSHADNGNEQPLTFDEQLNEMFKDIRI